MRITLAALALLILTSPAALADVKTFTYQLPTTFDDGSTLAPAQLAGVNVRCGRATGGPYTTYVSPLIPPTATTHQNDFTATGAWFCVATATATAAAGGKTSVFSNQATFTVAPAPRAPTAFSIE